MRATLSLILALFAVPAFSAEPPPLKLLFLGDNAGHKPVERFKLLEPAFKAKNIALTYTDKVEDLNTANLAKYDGLVVYANQTKISPEQEKALLDYVASGKGFIPLHCASYCFLNSPEYIALVGAQFRSHKTGTFTVENVKPDHPILKGYPGFQSWDETYVHHKHNEKDRIVLEVRAEGDLKEPWTWVRTHGKGRVFYTAWGHDQRTWNQPGFHNLVERGVRWACGQDPALAGTFAETTVKSERPEMTPRRTDVKPFEYVEAKIPLYIPKGDRKNPASENKMQKPLSPEESIKHFVTPKDFEVRTFVTEEKLGGKPLTMAWDERGRLWVSLTLDYPNELKPAGEGRDRIVICEDVDGDGVCDTVTTFADKLSIPTSILHAHGGIIVHSAPDTLFLKDTDGDGKADVRQVLFSGWGTGDTHAGPSNLRYGFDNWIYGMVGYSGFKGTVNNEALQFKQGFYRFKVEPDLKVSKLEFLRSTSNNSWGAAFSEDGQLFGSTANGCPLVHLTIPNRYYEKVHGLTPTVLPGIAADNHVEPITERVRQVDWHGGFTAAAGCSLYTARSYPKEYWNRISFVCEPTAHLVAAMVLEPDGATYKAHYGWNLLASDDEWSAPIQAEVGPDGQVWVIDWYNFIVQHNPTPQGFTNGKGNAYETPLRDKTHGRIYRVVYTKAKPEPRVNLKEATPEKLVETLKSDNMGWRVHAQRLLVERGKLGGVAALLDIPGTRNSATSFREFLLHSADLEASKAPGVVLKAFNDDASWSTRPELAEPLVRDSWKMAAGANAARTLETLLAKDRAASGPASSDVRELVEWVAREAAIQGTVDDLSRIFLACAARSREQSSLSAITDSILAGVASGWPTGKPAVASGEVEQSVLSLLPKVTPSTRTKLIKFATLWKLRGIDAQLAELTKSLVTTIADVKAADEARLEAARQVLDFQPEDETAVGMLLGAVTPQSSPAFTSGLFEALGSSRAKGLGSAVLAKLKDVPPSARPAALRLVLGRGDSARAFLDGVEAGKVRFDMLSLDQRAALASHPDKALAARARKLLDLGGGLPNADRQKVIEELSFVLKKSGSVDAGKKVFLQHCAKCHKHGSEGAQIGPDLSGFGTHPKEEILIHVLDPSRSVEGNYKAYRASTADGRVITGLLAAESKTAIEMVDAEGKRHPLQRDNIEALVETDKSLMPEGFEKQAKPEELADLLEFLTQKGKWVPLPLDRAATIVSTKGMFISEAGQEQRLIFPDWKPKTFEGVPFVLVDPQGDRVKNVILLHGPNGKVSNEMPKTASVPCNTSAKAIHLLSGVGGWNATGERNGRVCLIVRLHYADGKTEDHPLKDGLHFADYIRRVDVPGSKFAFALRGQQVRYLAIEPKRRDVIKTIEFVKGDDRSAPVVMAVTAETP